MRVLLSTYGSRGDVQPLVAVAMELKRLGVEAKVSAPPDEEFRELLAACDVALAPAFSPIRPWVAAARASGEPLPKLAAQMVRAQYDAIAAAAEDCDLILATGLFPSSAAACSVSEMKGIPYLHASFCPLFLPSPHHRPYEYPGWPHPPELADNQALWDRNIAVMNALFGEAFNSHRETIGLARVANVRDHVFTDHALLASDPVLSPWPGSGGTVVQTGAWLLADERPLPPALQAFLEAGEPPVYVGFGSMTMDAARNAAQLAVDAIRARGRRVLLFQGWADLAAGDDRDDCFTSGEVNQRALFGRVAAVIHHGGAGTTTTAALAGAPQLIVPQLVDQPYWAGRVAALGIGAAHDGPVPTSESLAVALDLALSPQTGERAAAVAGTIRSDGAAAAARLMLDVMERNGRSERIRTSDPLSPRQVR